MAQDWDVATVDPDDDDVPRFVVWHFRFDSTRWERRHVPVAAFDNELEYRAEMNRRWADLRNRQRVGDAEEVELITGSVKPAGWAAEHLRRRSMTPTQEAATRPSSPPVHVDVQLGAIDRAFRRRLAASRRKQSSGDVVHGDGRASP